MLPRVHAEARADVQDHPSGALRVPRPLEGRAQVLPAVHHDPTEAVPRVYRQAASIVNNQGRAAVGQLKAQELYEAVVAGYFHAAGGRCAH